MNTYKHVKTFCCYVYRILDCQYFMNLGQNTILTQLIYDVT